MTGDITDRCMYCGDGIYHTANMIHQWFHATGYSYCVDHVATMNAMALTANNGTPVEQLEGTMAAPRGSIPDAIDELDQILLDLRALT